MTKAVIREDVKTFRLESKPQIPAKILVTNYLLLFYV